MEYTFTLKYQLTDHDKHLDALANVWTQRGVMTQPDRLALEFIREARTAYAAV